MHPGSRSTDDTGGSCGGGCLEVADFADCFAAVSHRLWCVAVAIVGDAAGAEDVVQEAAVVALGKLEQFEPGSSFAGWMGQIVRFVALNEARRRTRHAGAADPMILDASQADDSHAKALPIDAHGELTPDEGSFDDATMRALGTLGETARACLLLRTLMDLSYREIAEVVGVPEGTAMSHVHRARGAMRRALGVAGGGRDGDEP